MERLHPRDREGMWREVLGRLTRDEEERRGYINPGPSLEPMDIPETAPGPKFSFPQISPGVAKKDERIIRLTVPVREAKGKRMKINGVEVPDPTPEESAQEILDMKAAEDDIAAGRKSLAWINKEREASGLLPLGTEDLRAPRDNKLLKRSVVDPAPAAIRYKTLAEVNKERAKLGEPPLTLDHEPPPGVWDTNGADWMSLDPQTQAEILQKFAGFSGFDPNIAKDISEMTENLIAAFKAASPQEQEFGEGWYAEAAERALELAARYNVDPHLVAAVIASTSPRTEWEKNLASAEVVLQSLLPEYSPDVTQDFLDTRMTVDTGLDGKPLKRAGEERDGVVLEEDELPPTGLEYLLFIHNREIEQTQTVEHLFDLTGRVQTMRIVKHSGLA